MSRTVTIECDPNEVRIAVGTIGLTGVVLEHLADHPLQLDPSEDLLSSPKLIEALQTLLKQVGMRNGNAIMCVRRSSVELRSLSLPAVDANELPDMVRFAAMRHFANASENWPIDFIAMPSRQENMLDCLAATINPTIIDRIHKTLSTLGLTLTQIVLRPMVSDAWAVHKQPDLANTAALLLEVVPGEADISIVDQGHVVTMRNIRFPATQTAEANQQAIINEMKRTMIAAASQRGELDVTQVRVWGSDAQHGELCRSISQALSIPAQSLNPLSLVDASKNAAGTKEGDLGKFASCIGALFANQLSSRLVDFSNPRKREEAKKPYTKYAIAGTAAAVLLIGGWAWYSMSHAQLDSEIKRLTELTKKNEESLKLAAKKQADWRKIEAFLEGDHQWLDELDYLSQHAIGSEQAIFSGATFSTDARTNTATIASKFVAKKQEDVPDILAKFRDSGHVVRSTSVSKSQDKSGMYPWVADLNIKLGKAVVPNPLSTKGVSESKPQESQDKPPAPANTANTAEVDSASSADATTTAKETPSSDEVSKPEKAPEQASGTEPTKLPEPTPSEPATPEPPTNSAEPTATPKDSSQPDQKPDEQPPAEPKSEAEPPSDPTPVKGEGE